MQGVLSRFISPQRRINERIRGALIAFGLQEANEMSPLISHGPVFVQSGASRSIVIESLRSFRPLYLPLCLYPFRVPRASIQKFILQSCRVRSLFPSMFLLISPHWPPRDCILSPRQRAFFHAHCRRKVGMALDTATAARSTSAEFAEGAEKGTREGVVAVIGP